MKIIFNINGETEPFVGDFDEEERLWACRDTGSFSWLSSGPVLLWFVPCVHWSCHGPSGTRCFSDVCERSGARDGSRFECRAHTPAFIESCGRLWCRSGRVLTPAKSIHPFFEQSSMTHLNKTTMQNERMTGLSARMFAFLFEKYPIARLGVLDHAIQSNVLTTRRSPAPLAMTHRVSVSASRGATIFWGHQTECIRRFCFHGHWGPLGRSTAWRRCN